MKKIAYLFAALLFVISLALASMVRSDIPVEELKAEYTNEASQFMNINGMNVHYRDEGSGFPLVLIHGTSSSLHTWDGWTNELKDEFRIIRMDIPGYALTGPHPEHDYSMKAYARFVKAVLDQLGVERCYMAGNSLGGNITWNFALQFPDIVEKMILIDASGYPMKEIPMVFKLAKSPLAPLLKHITPRFFIAKNINEVYGDDAKITDEIIDRYYELALREGNRDAFIERARKVTFSNYEKLLSITTPTLIMWGEADIWIDPKFAERFHKDLPNSKLITYPGVGHIPMEETPKITAANASQFLISQ